jgi:hypothetical protein
MRHLAIPIRSSLVAALLIVTVLGQDPDSRPRETRATDPDAIRLLREAAAVQVPGGAAPRITDFQADFQVTFYDEPEGGGAPVARSADVLELWLKQGRKVCYLRRLREEGGKETFLGWNGRQPWMREGKGPVVDLNDRNFKQDREQLTEEMRRVEEMVRYLFIEHLLTESAVFTFRERDATRKLESGEVTVDEILRRSEGDDPISILVSTDSRKVVGVRVNPATPQEDLLLFDYLQPLERVSPDGAVTRFLLPTRVEYFRGGRHDFSASTRRVSDIKFNTGIKPSYFNPPRD